MSKMRAVLFEQAGGPEVLYLGKADKPIASSNQILVKVKATALNRADTLQRRGLYPPPKGASSILGLEMSGTISEVGAALSQWKVGDKVCALLDGGAYAEYVNLNPDMLIKVSDDMSFEQAAAIPEVFLTAYQSLIYLLKLTADDTILIHAGASGVGTAAIQLAKSVGAKVIVTASKQKHDICRQLGADLIIDYKEHSFKKVIQESSFKNVNAILDVIAGSYFSDNLDLLSLDGRMVMLAALGGLKVSEANVGQIVWKRLNVMGSTLRSRSLDYKIKLTQDFVNDFWQDFNSGKLKPIIHEILDWTEVVRGHQMMEANENAGKIIMRVHD